MPIRVPVVLSRDEVSKILKELTGKIWIIGVILYGAGLRIQDCLELRVKDIDFDRHQIVVRRGKGQKDVRTMLPVVVRERLQAHLGEVKRQHERDLARCGTCRPTVRARPQVSDRLHGLGLAVRVSGRADLPRSAVGSHRLGFICTSRWCKRRSRPRCVEPVSRSE